MEKNSILKAGRITEGVLVILLSLMVGILSVNAGILAGRFVAVLLAGAAVAAVSCLFPDKKHFYLFLTVFFLPVNLNKALLKIDSSFLSVRDSITVSMPDVLLFILYCIWFYQMVHSREEGRKTVFFTFISIPFFVMFSAGILSFVNAGNTLYSTFGIFKLIKVFAYYFYAVNNIRSADDIKIILLGLLAGCGLQLSVAALQLAAGKTLGLFYLGELSGEFRSWSGFHQVYRIGALLGHPNFFANYLDFMIPLMLSLSFLKESVFVRRSATILFFGCITGMLFTLSRGGWAASGTGAFIAFIMLAARNAREKCFLRKTFVLIIIVFCAGAAFSPKIIERVTSKDGGAANTRLEQIRVAENVIKEHPVCGIGLNNYSLVMEDYDETYSKVSRSFKAPVHNAYLLVLAETGILGFLGYIALYLSIFRHGFVNAGRSRGFLFNLNTGLLCGFIANALHISIDLSLLNRLPYFLFLGGLFTVVDHSINKKIKLEGY
ncbi:MAG: O-antigen ligase family protein [Candidatus Omnitrophota bacterium]